MNKQQEPRLRFKGFVGAWEEKYLGKLAEQVKSYPLSRNVETSEKTGFKYIHYGDIHRGIADIIDSDENLPNIQAGNFELLKSGDLVIADVSEDYDGVGAACVIDGSLKNKVVSGLHTIAIRPNQTISLFLYYLLKTQAFKQYGRLIGTGTKVVGITASKFLNFQTNIPTLPEQTHLGLFFRCLDSQIAESRAVLEKSRQLKKAMLAKMFPANGEKIPKIRFKGFEGEWEKVVVGDLGDIVTGNTPTTSDKDNYAEDGLLWVTPTDIKKTVTTKTMKSLSEKGKKSARLLPPNSILVTCIASIGKNTLIVEWGSCNQQINALIPKKEFNPYFLFVLSEFWSEKMKKIAGSGTMDIINKTQFSEIETMLPIPKEQTAIGNFFRQLDETIALQSAEVEKLNQLKKGLLAAMLV